MSHMLYIQFPAVTNKATVITSGNLEDVIQLVGLEHMNLSAAAHFKGDTVLGSFTEYPEPNSDAQDSKGRFNSLYH